MFHSHFSLQTIHPPYATDNTLFLHYILPLMSSFMNSLHFSCTKKNSNNIGIIVTLANFWNRMAFVLFVQRFVTEVTT